MAKKNNNQLLYLAVLAIALLMIPFVISAMQQRAFTEGFAAGDSSGRIFDTQ